MKNLSQTLSVLVLIESCWKASLSVVVTKLLKHHSQTLSVVVEKSNSLISCSSYRKLLKSHSVVVVAIEIVEKSNSFSSCSNYRKLLKNKTLSVVIVAIESWCKIKVKLFQ